MRIDAFDIVAKGRIAKQVESDVFPLFQASLKSIDGQARQAFEQGNLEKLGVLFVQRLTVFNLINALDGAKERARVVLEKDREKGEK